MTLTIHGIAFLLAVQGMAERLVEWDAELVEGHRFDALGFRRRTARLTLSDRAAAFEGSEAKQRATICDDK